MTSSTRPRGLHARVVVLAGALGVVATLGSGCLPDQIDGQQEAVEVAPALDLSWYDETSAPDVIDAGLVAMADIGSVRVHQDAETGETGGGDGSGRAVVSKDLLLAVGEGIGDAVAGDCTGTLQLPSWSTPADLVVQDDLGAFRGDTDFWLGFGDDELADVRDQLAATYAGQWTTTPGLASLCDFTDFLSPVSGLVGDEDAVKAGLGDVAGVPAARIEARSKPMTVTTWVSIAEPHLVLRVSVERRGQDIDGSQTTVTTFSDVDSAVEVDFPAPEDILAFEVPAAPLDAAAAAAAG